MTIRFNDNLKCDASCRYDEFICLHRKNVLERFTVLVKCILTR